MKKKMMRILSASMLSIVLCLGCSNSQEVKSEPAGTSKEETDAEDEALKVVFLCNGNLGDRGFNDSAASGIQMLKDEMGAEIKMIELGRDESTFEGNWLDVSEGDWDMIVSGTFGLKELGQEIAAQYPDKNYLMFDVEVDREVVTDGNMMGINYKTNESAFLSGVLAAKMLLESGDAKIDSSEKTLGFVGSMDSVNINVFLVGYLEGIQYVDPEIKVLTSYVGSFEDVSKCMELTTQLYNQGAQIVYAPTSQSMMGAATAAHNMDKYLIACDTDLYESLKESDPELASNIISSSLKNVGESIYTAVKSWKEGEMSLSENYTLGLDSGAVGLAKNENYKEVVPEGVQEFLDETEQKIIHGDIEVDSAFVMSTEDIASLRDSMKP